MLKWAAQYGTLMGTFEFWIEEREKLASLLCYCSGEIGRSRQNHWDTWELVLVVFDPFPRVCLLPLVA